MSPHKIYVPDGLGDLMDALSDPRAFLSAQEKRMMQMKSMGIEETDIQTANLALISKKQEEEKNKAVQDSKMVEPVSITNLRNDKAYVKLMRKQQKAHESLKRKHVKEKQLIQKQQCVAIDKLVKQNGKTNRELASDPAVRDIVVDQVKQWSEMGERHRRAEVDMLKEQLVERGVYLKKLLQVSQAFQMKQLELRIEREIKEMKSGQAKVSVETAKEVSLDKTLRNKAERERRLREKNSNNTKKFIEERRAIAAKHDKEREKLKRQQEKQILELDRETENVSFSLARVASRFPSSCLPSPFLCTLSPSPHASKPIPFLAIPFPSTFCLAFFSLPSRSALRLVQSCVGLRCFAKHLSARLAFPFHVSSWLAHLSFLSFGSLFISLKALLRIAANLQ